MIDIRCITDCASPDCVLVVAPKYCICTEGDTVSTDAGGFKQPAPTDTAEAAARNPSLVTGESGIGGEVAQPSDYAGGIDTLSGAAGAIRLTTDRTSAEGEQGDPLTGDAAGLRQDAGVETVRSSEEAASQPL